MVEALQQQETDPSYQEMDFQERLGLLVDWEFSKLQHSRLQRLYPFSQIPEYNSLCGGHQLWG